MGLRTALAVLACMAPAAAFAEGDASRATQLFDEGRTLLAQGKLAEACAVFEKSYALDPAPGTGLNLADCAERAGDVARARKLYEDAALAFESAKQPGRATFARNRMANLVKLRAKDEKPVPPAEPNEIRHETEGTVSAPEHNHRVSKRVALVGGVLTLASGVVLIYGGHTAREYQAGTGAVDGTGRPLGSENCASGKPVAGDVEGFRTACRWRFVSFFAAPTFVLAGTTTLLTLIYIASTPNRPAGGVALRPVIAPGAVGASLSLSF